jgi:hypothetical protein
MNFAEALEEKTKRTLEERALNKFVCLSFVQWVKEQAEKITHEGKYSFTISPYNRTWTDQEKFNSIPVIESDGFKVIWHDDLKLMEVSWRTTEKE